MQCVYCIKSRVPVENCPNCADVPIPKITTRWAKHLSKETIQEMVNEGWNGGEIFFISGNEGTVKELVKEFDGDLELYDSYLWSANKDD